MVLLLKCNEDTFIDELNKEKSVLNKTLNASSFLNSSNKRTKSSDFIKLNDSVNNLNSSLLIHQIRPVTYQVENKPKVANEKEIGKNNIILTSLENHLENNECSIKNTLSKNKINENPTLQSKVVLFFLFCFYF